MRLKIVVYIAERCTYAKVYKIGLSVFCRTYVASVGYSNNDIEVCGWIYQVPQVKVNNSEGPFPGILVRRNEECVGNENIVPII